MKRFQFFLVGLLVANAVVAADKSGFYLKDGDRVVFYGDSITDQRLYTVFVETYAITRFPKMSLTFVHSGWGGDRVTGGGGGPIDTRLHRDVFAYKPTVMTIMLGMNDGSYTNFQEKIFNTYTKGYEHIVASVKQNVPGIRLTLIQPSPFDDVTQPPRFEGGYNQVLVRYGEFVKDLAGRNGATVADLNGPVVAALEKAKSINAERAKQIIADRVHPGPAGQLLMANALLKAWNAPAIVTDVEIDAKDNKVVRSDGAKISGLKVGQTISWKQEDASLPMPLSTTDPVMALALKSSDVVESLDQQLLKVTGLSPGSYTLNIDGESIGKFSAEDLAKGVNLGLLPTAPMYKQASQVHKLVIEHNDVHFNRWRQVQVPLANIKGGRTEKAVQHLIDALDQDEADLLKQLHKTKQPKPHQFVLSPSESK